MGMGMNYNKWVETNYLQLSHNYNNRDISSSFDEFCGYIYMGIINKCWLPVEYTNGLK